MRVKVPLWIAAVVACAALPNIASAGSITYSNLEFLDPVVVLASGNDAAISNATIVGEGGTYTLSAHFCLTGFCPGDSASSDKLRLTFLTLTCSGGGTCAPLDISFEADGTTAAGTTGLDTWLTNGSFTGTGPSGYVKVCIQDSSHVCTATADGTQSDTFTFDSGLVGADNFFFPESGTFTLIGDFHINGLASGSTVSISNSLDIADLVTPEPGSIVLITSGVAALLLLRRRRVRS